MARAQQAAALRKVVSSRGVAESARRASAEASRRWRKALVDAVDAGISRREITRHLNAQGIVIAEETVRKSVAEGYGERRS